jgi:hypothetical protein
MKREIEVQQEQVAAEPTAASTVKYLVSSPKKQVLLPLMTLSVTFEKAEDQLGCKNIGSKFFLLFSGNWK